MTTFIAPFYRVPYLALRLPREMCEEFKHGMFYFADVDELSAVIYADRVRLNCDKWPLESPHDLKIPAHVKQEIENLDFTWVQVNRLQEEDTRFLSRTGGYGLVSEASERQYFGESKISVGDSTLFVEMDFVHRDETPFHDRLWAVPHSEKPHEVWEPDRYIRYLYESGSNRGRFIFGRRGEETWRDRIPL